MSIQTDATSQQIQHPLPGSLVNITNLIPQTRVKVTRADTGGLLQQASCGDGTTLNFDFQYTGSVKIEARNASSIPAYKPWITQVSISPTATTNVVALQESDQ
jgi:2-keto-4-pentenoate hydratase